MNSRLKSVVTCPVEKSDGRPYPFVGLEDIGSGTGSLITGELPLKAALDSVLHRPGDVLFSKLRPYLAKSYKPESRGSGTGELLVLRPQQCIDSRFLLYVTLSSPWLEWAVTTSYGTKMPRTSWEAMSEYRLNLPTLDEQRRIADFLDAETVRVDALIERRNAQRAVLAELELARIGEHLRGADPNTDRTGTGWRWLPSIPAGWMVGPIYAYFDIQLGKMLNAERASGERQQSYLRNANVHWYEIDTDDLATMTFEPDEKIRYGLHAGDLMVCEGGAGVAEAAVWDGRISKCFYQKSLHRVRPARHLPVEWLMYWLRFAKAAGVFDADGNLATIPHLTGEQLAEYRIPIPADGHRRVAELGSDIAAIRKTQVEMASADALLFERRQVLVTAAVTGQIDVTTARSLSSSGSASV
jgi:type I restriction enzyme S subunit